MKDLLLLGASGLAREIMSADLPGQRVVGVLDDNPHLHGTTVDGVEVLGGIEEASRRPESLLLCVGSGLARRAIATRLRAIGVADPRYATVVDASVRVPGSCVIGHGSILLAGVVLTADIQIGAHVVAMPNVTLTHDNEIGDFVTIAAGVVLGGSVRVLEAAYLGMKSSVREGLIVGDGSTVGMGAVVLSSVPAGATWVGNPARPISRRQTMPPISLHEPHANQSQGGARW